MVATDITQHFQVGIPAILIEQHNKLLSQNLACSIAKHPLRRLIDRFYRTIRVDSDDAVYNIVHNRIGPRCTVAQCFPLPHAVPNQLETECRNQKRHQEHDIVTPKDFPLQPFQTHFVSDHDHTRLEYHIQTVLERLIHARHRGSCCSFFLRDQLGLCLRQAQRFTLLGQVEDLLGKVNEGIPDRLQTGYDRCQRLVTLHPLLHGNLDGVIALFIGIERSTLFLYFIVFQYIVAGAIQITPGAGQRIDVQTQLVQFGGFGPHRLDLHQQASTPYEESDNNHPGGDVE